MPSQTRSFFAVIGDMIRIGIVYLFLAGLVLLFMSNWVIPYFNILKPEILLTAVFYWALYRPGMMPSWAIFCAGLMLDAMNPGLPFGTHAFGYLLVAGIVRSKRRMLMAQPFIMIWVAFVAAVAVNMTVTWIASELLTSQSLNMRTLGLNAFMSVLCFPVVMPIFVFLHRFLPASRGMIAS